MLAKAFLPLQWTPVGRIQPFLYQTILVRYYSEVQQYEKRYRRNADFTENRGYYGQDYHRKDNRGSYNRKPFYRVDRAVWAKRRQEALQTEKDLIENPGEGSADESSREYFIKHSITILNDKVKPECDLADLNMSQAIRDQLMKKFSAPTPIQAVTWPILGENKNIVAISSTGSGKTLAFGISMLNQIGARDGKNYSKREAAGLIVAPTRELAQQIDKELSPYLRALGLASAVCVGGSSKFAQLSALRNSCDVIIGTPGRLMDLAEELPRVFSKIQTLVLDEADRMLDMGFEPQIRDIIGHLPAHQTALFSATWPKEIRSLARQLLGEYVHVTVGSSELTINENITQRVMCIRSRARMMQLLQDLEDFASMKYERILIFVSTKRLADEIADYLAEYEHYAASLHGDKSQHQRERLLYAFRFGRIQCLIATNVAARGLDIKDVKAVINFDFPETIEDYVHRIGRTGRAGKFGLAVSYFTEKDITLAKDVYKLLKKANQKIPETIKEIASSDRQNERGDLNRRQPVFSEFVPSNPSEKITIDSEEKAEIREQQTEEELEKLRQDFQDRLQVRRRNAQEKNIKPMFQEEDNQHYARKFKKSRRNSYNRSY